MPPGIEPGTQGFSVLCSTNWAMAPFSFAVAKVGVFFVSAKKKRRKLCKSFVFVTRGAFHVISWFSLHSCHQVLNDLLHRELRVTGVLASLFSSYTVVSCYLSVLKCGWHGCKESVGAPVTHCWLEYRVLSGWWQECNQVRDTRYLSCSNKISNLITVGLLILQR